MAVAVVVGNPKPVSRTLDAATRVARGLQPNAEPDVLDLVTLGSEVLDWGSPTVAAAIRRIAGSDIAIFASPTFKATYSGLLKLFLDQFAGGSGLARVVAVPVMLGAGPGHALAPDLLLKPVLVELGATCPSPGLYLSQESYRDDGVIARYVYRWGSAIRACTLKPVNIDYA